MKKCPKEIYLGRISNTHCISFVYTVLILLAVKKKGAAKLQWGVAQRPVLLVTAPKMTGALQRRGARAAKTH
jgi:hypothetical protein